MTNIIGDDCNFKGTIYGDEIRFILNNKTQGIIKLKNEIRDGITMFNVPCIVTYNRTSEIWGVVIGNEVLEIAGKPQFIRGK